MGAKVPLILVMIVIATVFEIAVMMVMATVMMVTAASMISCVRFSGHEFVAIYVRARLHTMMYGAIYAVVRQHKPIIPTNLWSVSGLAVLLGLS